MRFHVVCDVMIGIRIIKSVAGRGIVSGNTCDRADNIFAQDAALHQQSVYQRQRQ